MKPTSRDRCLAFLSVLCAGVFLIIQVCAASQQQAPKERKTIDLETGAEITAQDVKSLEAVLVDHPDNLDVRRKLLEYYFETETEFLSPELEKKRQAHIFWVIEHHPESELAGSPEASITPGLGDEALEGYQHAKDLWLEQLKTHASDVHVILHAIEFFQLASNREETAKLVQEALQIAPTNTEVLSTAAHHFELERIWRGTDGQRKELSEQALALRDRELQSTDAADRPQVIMAIATDAFEAGDLARAEQSANELLRIPQSSESDWDSGGRIHKGNIILGRIALRRGDVEGAKAHLLAAGNVSGSPVLGSFGPNMTLAKELLEKGERETVLAYLQECAKFWTMGGDKIQNWSATIKGGGIPDFEANLDY